MRARLRCCAAEWRRRWLNPSADVLEEDDPVVQFTVQRYAHLCMDLIEPADGEESFLQKYGITASQRAELDAYWTPKMSEDTTIWLALDLDFAERRAAEVEAS